MDRNIQTILLSGVPRSGTTLCCHLLNRFNNTVAIHEPIDSERFSSNRDDAVATIKNFVRDVRTQALTKGSIPSKQRDGEIPANPVSTYNDKRVESVALDEIILTKPLADDFLMVVKHNALFAALEEELRASFKLFALVRNPLPVLASWRSVDLPVGEGKLPMGERFCAELSRALSDEGDVLERQLIILKWFFDAYRNLESSNVLTYEELVHTNGEVLTQISPHSLNEPIALKKQLKNSGLDTKEIRRLSSELLARPEVYEGFYSPDDIEIVLREMI